MNDTELMLSKQYLLRVRQEGYTLVENFPQTVASNINIDIYRGKAKTCTFDDCQLGDWSLRVSTDDSTREDIEHDYDKLFRMFIDLRDLYMIYDSTEPIRGYDQSLGYRTITQHGNCVLAVRGGNRLGEIEFGTFITGRNSYNRHTACKRRGQQAHRPARGDTAAYEGVDLMPSSIELSGLEMRMVNAMSREFVLKRYLQEAKPD